MESVINWQTYGPWTQTISENGWWDNGKLMVCPIDIHFGPKILLSFHSTEIIIIKSSHLSTLGQVTLRTLLVRNHHDRNHCVMVFMCVCARCVCMWDIVKVQIEISSWMAHLYLALATNKDNTCGFLMACCWPKKKYCRFFLHSYHSPSLPLPLSQQ